MEAHKRNEEPELRRTTQEELGLLIDDVAQAILGSAGGLKVVEGEEMEPRFITASDLVRRMHPFLVYN